MPVYGYKKPARHPSRQRFASDPWRRCVHFCHEQGHTLIASAEQMAQVIAGFML